MTAVLMLTDSTGVIVTQTYCTSFTFQKERYTPYSTLRAVFRVNQLYSAIPTAAQLTIGTYVVHYGLIDTLSTEYRHDSCLMTLTSRGFTSLLMQNQMAAGMMNNVTLQSLMESYAVPHVTYESGIETMNYVWVKTGSTQWAAIANYTYKYNGRYPYIAGTNEVHVTEPSTPQLVALTDTEMLRFGVRHDYSKLVSHYHMDDISGNANVYSYVCEAATDREIMRHRQCAFDQQFLYQPADALLVKAKQSQRGMLAYYGSYVGYRGEDLEDTVTFGTQFQPALRISALVVSGDASGITTTLSAYRDAYCNLIE